MLPWYYRQLLDAGAAGACPFYYADGWWKGGEPAEHNDTPEEWFGFWGYKNLEDTVGYPRPVWHAMKHYNNAIISSPKNQMFYKNKVPLEIFLHSDVKSIKVVYNDRIIYSQNDITNNYLIDSISFAEPDLRDRELIFEFYDENNKIIKLENIIILTGEREVEWPKVTITSPLKNIKDNKEINIEITLENNSVFSLAKEVRYLFSTHIGWSRGERRLWNIDSALQSQSMKDSHTIPEESPLMGLYVGTEITYGKFVKTIHDQKLIYRGTWADPIRLK